MNKLIACAFLFCIFQHTFAQKVNRCFPVPASNQRTAQGPSEPSFEVLSLPPSSSSVYHLQSLPGADKVIYLDFDGQYVASTSWKNNNVNFPGQPIKAAAANVSENDILMIWKTIREDFMPFQVNVTTDSSIYNQAVWGKRQMCIFTPSDEWCGALGISLFSSFNYDEPCFAFTKYNKGKAAAEVGSHELGHTFGLSHDGTTTTDYYNGQGSYPTTWSPIMGSSHSSNMTQWSKGEYQNANRFEDDVAIIATKLGYKTDEAGSSIATAKLMTLDAAGTVEPSLNTGVITTSTDVDVYSFTTTGGNVVLTIYGAPDIVNSIGGQTCAGNMDMLLQLKDAAGTVLATAYDQNSASGTFTQTLAAGTYYLFIDGTGYLNPFTNGYSDYGSIGEYSISGSIPSGTNQAPVVQITGLADHAFIPRGFIYFPIVTATATDPDGTISKVEFYTGSTLLITDATAPYEYMFMQNIAGVYPITAKAIDNSGNIGFSQTITMESFEPHVKITSPADMASFNEGDNISITAFADVQWSRYIDRVEFFDGNTLLGTVTSAPYTYTLTNASPGNHVIKATATMSYYLGVNNSSTITVTVNPTVVTTAIDAEKILGLHVSPNPSTGTFSIQVPAALLNAQVHISNGCGQTVYSNLLPENGCIEIGSVTPGIYMVWIQGATVYAKETIIIQ